jgi:hypothetical protein
MQPFLHIAAAGCLTTAYLFWIQTFIGDYRRTLKISFDNNPEPKLASPLKKTTIETLMSSIKLSLPFLSEYIFQVFKSDTDRILSE